MTPLWRHSFGGALCGLLLLVGAASTARATPSTNATTLIESKQQAPVAFAAFLNPVESGISALVNKLVQVSSLLLLGDGQGACVLNPQAYALTDGSIGGVGALVGFRIFSGRRYHGLYFGVRFGGGVGNESFKTFMGQIDAGYTWAFGAFRIGLGVNAGGGYMAYRDTRGSLYLFSLDVSIGFAMGRFKSAPTK